MYIRKTKTRTNNQKNKRKETDKIDSKTKQQLIKLELMKNAQKLIKKLKRG